MRKIWISAFGFIVLAAAAFAWAVPVPDSGQTKCYNNTVEIPCPISGQPFYGQAANYSINPMSYTKLDGSGNALPDSAEKWSMVKDNVTGLIWEVKTDDGTINDKDKTYTWYDPTDPNPGSQNDVMNTKDFIDGLNISHFGGYGDWRMPTVRELGSIIEYNIPGRNVNADYFPNTQPSSYWSSTTYAYYPFYAWGVSFSDGHDDYSRKTYYKPARAVRGGLPGSSSGNTPIAPGGYAVNNDGTVTDASTGLMWQQNGPSDNMTWEQALAYCEGLNLGDYRDWRLPAKKELRSLVDFSRYNPSINTTYFPDTNLSFYWSSTTDLYITDFAWGVYFYAGDDGFGNKLSYGYVRAVRGGQAPASKVCTATIDENFLLHIPYLSYVNPLLGTLSLWADFVYEFNPTYPTVIIFKLTSSGIIENSSYLCAASTSTSDLKIRIPDLLFPDGITHIRVDLEYSPVLSTDANSYFVVTDYETN